MVSGFDTAGKCDEVSYGVREDRDRNLDVEPDYDSRRREILDNKTAQEVDKGWSSSCQTNRT
jgi:hypothetical protein